MDTMTDGYECPKCHSRDVQKVLGSRIHEGSRIIKLECQNIVEVVDSTGLVMGNEKCGEVWEDI